MLILEKGWYQIVVEKRAGESIFLVFKRMVLDSDGENIDVRPKEVVIGPIGLFEDQDTRLSLKRKYYSASDIHDLESAGEEIWETKCSESDSVRNWTYSPKECEPICIKYAAEHVGYRFKKAPDNSKT